jgi:hypothetical protein
MPRILRAPESQIASIEFLAAKPRESLRAGAGLLNVRIRAFTGGHSHEQYNRFSNREAPVETECLPDHIGAKQAGMLLALFELKDVINDLTRLVESGQHIAKPSVGSEQISA